ncbi:hypothetical protein E2C01_085379 [Portunus trituberculatus]|uniref:C-type lectin domain-containing protein n=1 Tax=Portunus trituberculatus TaxID=210409 RepID=A0A5B7J6N8_PORTR|nr:hypothetical protein [Portunus trituberculatus]
MRQYCQELGGDLVKLADIEFYCDIILYLNNLNLPNVNFWIGATHQENEGYWLWTDGTPVRMGTPYWFVEITIQSPFFGNDYNCGCINYFEYYYFRDCVCNSTTLSPSCQAVM